MNKRTAEYVVYSLHQPTRTSKPCLCTELVHFGYQLVSSTRAFIVAIANGRLKKLSDHHSSMQKEMFYQQSDERKRWVRFLRLKYISSAMQLYKLMCMMYAYAYMIRMIYIYIHTLYIYIITCIYIYIYLYLFIYLLYKF